MAADALVVAGQAKARHPLSQIAESGTHRLLLKQWLKEEDLLARRVALREARLDGARKEIAFLYCAFFAFHAASILLLFLSASASTSAACRRSWIPCLVSLLSSLAMLWALRYKADTEAVLERLLAREREDALLLGKCVAELKRKGLEFDLLKRWTRCAAPRACASRPRAAPAARGPSAGRPGTSPSSSSSAPPAASSCSPGTCSAISPPNRKRRKEEIGSQLRLLGVDLIPRCSFVQNCLFCEF